MEDREESSSQNPWEILEKSLSNLKKRLEALEARIGSLEQGKNRVIMDETTVPDSPGMLGGKTLASVSGSIQKIIRIPVCDLCGQKLDHGLTICQRCGRKVCSRCIVNFNAKSLCAYCAAEIFQLNKRDVKVLTCLACGMKDENSISEITGLSRREIRLTKAKLMKLKMMRKTGISILSSLEITEQGHEAAEALRRLYRRDKDFAVFERVLAEKVRKNELKVERSFGIYVNSSYLPRLAHGSDRNKLLGSRDH